MKSDSKILRRKSIRLKDYDYSQAGYYFITVCTEDKLPLLGSINGGIVNLSKYGKVVFEELLKTEVIRSNVHIDIHVIMPNHIHFIIVLDGMSSDYNDKTPNTETFYKSTKNSVPTIVKLFKSVTTKRINEIRKQPGMKFWQRNYYEHVIRNDRELFEIRKYIENNPLEWVNDEYFLK